MPSAAIPTDQARPKPARSLPSAVRARQAAISPMAGTTRHGAYDATANAAAATPAPMAITVSSSSATVRPGTSLPTSMPAISAMARPPETPAMMPAVASRASIIRADEVT